MLAIADLIHEQQGRNHEKLCVFAAHFRAAIEELKKSHESMLSPVEKKTGG
jgi:hypothetical protein